MTLRSTAGCSRRDSAQQTIAGFLIAGSAVVGAQRLPARRLAEIGSKLAVSRDRLVKLLRNASFSAQDRVLEDVIVIHHRMHDRHLLLIVGDREAVEVQRADVEIAALAAASEIELGQRVVGRQSGADWWPARSCCSP